jgi:hypothetical protein
MGKRLKTNFSLFPLYKKIIKNMGKRLKTNFWGGGELKTNLYTTPCMAAVKHN